MDGSALALGVVGGLTVAAWAQRGLMGSQAHRRGALTEISRARLPDRDFAVVEYRHGRKIRKYPIHDKRHGQIALTYVMSPSNASYREEVKRAVFARYPGLRAWWKDTAWAKAHEGRHITKSKSRRRAA